MKWRIKICLWLYVSIWSAYLQQEYHISNLLKRTVLLPIQSSTKPLIFNRLVAEKKLERPRRCSHDLCMSWISLFIYYTTYHTLLPVRCQLHARLCCFYFNFFFVNRRARSRVFEKFTTRSVRCWGIGTRDAILQLESEVWRLVFSVFVMVD